MEESTSQCPIFCKTHIIGEVKNLYPCYCIQMKTNQKAGTYYAISCIGSLVVELVKNHRPELGRQFSSSSGLCQGKGYRS